MNKTEINKYKTILKAKRAELSRGLLKRNGIEAERVSDEIEQVQSSGERELAVTNLERKSNLLRQVNGALTRIANGSYGACVHCEEEIKPKRITALPWASHCISCQEAADRCELTEPKLLEVAATA